MNHLQKTELMEPFKFDYKKLRSEIFLKYNIELDETSLSVLHILSVETKTELSKMTRSINNATEKINASTTSLQIDTRHPRWQAFWFGMGKWGFAVIFSATTLFIYKVIRNEEIRDNRQLRKEWQWYKSYYELRQTHKAKDLKDFLKNNPPPE